MLLVLLSFGVSASATDSIKVWHDLRNKNSDIGFEVGDWLKKTYSSDIRILTDSGFFYIPLIFSSVLRPKFWGGWGAKRTGRMSEAEWQAKRSEYDRELARNLILAFDPDVIVLGKSEHHTPLLDIAQLVASDPLMRSREYRIVKVFQARPERGGGLLKWQAVFIYEKASTKRVVGSDVRDVHEHARGSLPVS